MNKMKILILAGLIGLTGCSESTGYKEFVKEHGNSSRYFCDKTGFLMHEYFYQKSQDVPILRIKENDLDQPIRCGEAGINVLETSAGTQRTF